MKNKVKKFWNFKVLDEKTGELTIYGEISDVTWWGDEVTPKRFKEELDALGYIDTLNIYINSYGGDVFAGQTIYSMLKRHKAQKNVYIDGVAASIASLIAMAGDKVIMPANAMMMVHNPWATIGIVAGNAEELRKFAEDVKKLADDLDKIRDSMVVAYESHSALTKKEIIELLDAETWLTAEECLEYGFADEIEEAKEAAAYVDEKYFSVYRNIPEELKQPSEEGVKNSEDELKKKKLLLELEL